jgi:hypothetical protein
MTRLIDVSLVLTTPADDLVPRCSPAPTVGSADLAQRSGSRGQIAVGHVD